MAGKTWLLVLAWFAVGILGSIVGIFGFDRDVVTVGLMLKGLALSAFGPANLIAVAITWVGQFEHVVLWSAA